MVRHHFNPPREEDFRTEEEYLEAYADWEDAEDDYAEQDRESRMLEEV